MSKPWILISPSSRGIGHALTRHLLHRTTLPILSTCRASPSTVKSSLLQDLPVSCSERLTVLEVDVTSESTLEAASQKAAKLFPPETHHLHLGFAIPGILYPEKSPGQVEYEKGVQTMQVNVLGPLMLMKYFGEFLPGRNAKLAAPDNSGREQGKGQEEMTKLPSQAIWLNMSARVGSISDNRLGGWYTYRASKAGVNALTRSFDHYLGTKSGKNAIAIAYHPGTVKTGLSKQFWGKVREDMLFEPEFAVEKMVEVVGSRGEEDRGKVWDWKGEEVPP